MLRKCINQVKDRPRCLTVEAGGGLVQEQKKLRLRCEFNANGETFALFNVETCRESVTL